MAGPLGARHAGLDFSGSSKEARQRAVLADPLYREPQKDLN